jgi:hypothetical protein
MFLNPAKTIILTLVLLSSGCESLQTLQLKGLNIGKAVEIVTVNEPFAQTRPDSRIDYLMGREGKRNKGFEGRVYTIKCDPECFILPTMCVNKKEVANGF